jgi:putative SOS response-associated peptidase YedK
LSCAIDTTTPRGGAAPNPARRPASGPRARHAEWLDPAADPTRLAELLVPWAGEMEAVAVSTWVNAPGHDDPRCVEPIALEG